MSSVFKGVDAHVEWLPEEFFIFARYETHLHVEALWLFWADGFVPSVKKVSNRIHTILTLLLIYYRKE